MPCFYLVLPSCTEFYRVSFLITRAQVSLKCQLISRVAGQFEGGRGLPSFAKFQQFFYFKFFFSVQSLFPVGFWCAEFRVPYLRPGNVGVGRHFVFCFFFRSLFSFCFLLFLFVAFLFLSRRRRRRNQKRIGNRRCLPVCFCFFFGSVFFFFSRAAIFNMFFFLFFYSPKLSWFRSIVNDPLRIL